MSAEFTKYCFAREIDIYKICASHGIAPPIIRIEGRMLTTKRMKPLIGNLGEWVDPATYIPQVVKLISKLHSLGILWMDTHLGNVVSDENGRIYLIDFDSILIEDIFKNEVPFREHGIENLAEAIEIYKKYEVEHFTRPANRKYLDRPSEELIGRFAEAVFEVYCLIDESYGENDEATKAFLDSRNETAHITLDDAVEDQVSEDEETEKEIARIISQIQKQSSDN